MTLHRSHEDAVGAAIGNGVDLEQQTVPRDGRAGEGVAGEEMVDETAHGVDVLGLSDVAVEDRLQAAQREEAGDPPSALDRLDRAFVFEVEFVVDLAHHQFEEVFERHQTGKTAELVEHQGDVLSRMAKILHEVGQGAALGNEEGRHHELRPRVVGQQAQEMFGVKDADDVVR